MAVFNNVLQKAIEDLFTEIWDLSMGSISGRADVGVNILWWRAKVKSLRDIANRIEVGIGDKR